MSTDIKVGTAPIPRVTSPLERSICPVATLAMDVAGTAACARASSSSSLVRPGSVDIPAARRRAAHHSEHPEVRTVVLTSAVFGLGLLAPTSSCSGPVRARVEGQLLQVHQDAQRPRDATGILASSSGAAVNWLVRRRRLRAGARDEIWLVDDRSSSVALPEVPLLGVLPGTGGLTPDRQSAVRHDRADVFCTVSEGIRGQRRRTGDWSTSIVKTGEFARCAGARWRSELERPSRTRGACCCRISREATTRTAITTHVEVAIDRRAHRDVHAVRAPAVGQPTDVAGIGRGRRMVAARLRARARRRDPHHAHQRARIGTWLREERRRSGRGARRGRDASRATRATGWCARRRVPAARTLARPRRVVAHALRAGRARLVLRGDAARGRARRRPTTCCAPERADAEPRSPRRR